ncbi:hypothetical protein [Aridibaculum aurantiacum]|uniref:hypothetical protein n=1 Tax=Aridibaculum aurantiacum TaxID=2810307 RepID=UPI001A95B930|nr:hypothetical protein [Aridibaculum aurantiacum]
MKISFLFSLLLLCLLVTGCKKQTEFIVKFEITSTAPATAPFNLVATKIGLQEIASIPGLSAGSTSWDHTKTVNTEYRPLDIYMAPANIYLTAPGSATLRISINGEVKAEKTYSSTDLQGQNMVSTVGLTYTIK